MARPMRNERILVLRRTKLGESDCIITGLTPNGSQVRAVAKGARKPTSTFASRLEVFAVCDVLLVEGKSLDIVREARLVDGNASLRGNYEATMAASPMVELLSKVTDTGTETPNLFPMTCRALTALTEQGADAKLLCCAHLIKALALLGHRPSLDTCILCGCDVTGMTIGSLSAGVAFSYEDGGVVCPRCQHQVSTTRVNASVIGWAHALLYSTFDDIVAMEVPDELNKGLLRLLQLWIRTQVQVSCRSLDLLLTL